MHQEGSLKATISVFLLKHYVSPQGVDLFGLWLDELRDKQARARVSARLLRLQNGNFGDCKPVGAGVWELRIDWGPGYRVYYALADKKVVLLCQGGDKRSQQADIDRTVQRWLEWQTRSST
jgi:putative addiction module killer protein